MAAIVLNSPEAVAVSVFVVRAFMQMCEQLTANTAILKRLAEIDDPIHLMIAELFRILVLAHHHHINRIALIIQYRRAVHPRRHGGPKHTPGGR